MENIPLPLQNDLKDCIAVIREQFEPNQAIFTYERLEIFLSCEYNFLKEHRAGCRLALNQIYYSMEGEDEKAQMYAEIFNTKYAGQQRRNVLLRDEPVDELLNSNEVLKYLKGKGARGVKDFNIFTQRKAKVHQRQFDIDICIQVLKENGVKWGRVLDRVARSDRGETGVYSTVSYALEDVLSTAEERLEKFGSQSWILESASEASPATEVTSPQGPSTKKQQISGYMISQAPEPIRTGAKEIESIVFAGDSTSTSSMANTVEQSAPAKEPLTQSTSTEGPKPEIGMSTVAAPTTTGAGKVISDTSTTGAYGQAHDPISEKPSASKVTSAPQATTRAIPTAPKPVDNSKAILDTIKKLEGEAKGESTRNSVSLAKKYKKSTRKMLFAVCKGAKNCKNPLCNNTSSELAREEEPTDPVLIALLKASRKDGYPISIDYATKFLDANDKKLIPTLKAIKNDIDNRISALESNGRFSYAEYAVRPDPKYDTVDGLQRFLEFDDDQLHQFYLHGWDSYYGQCIKKYSRSERVKWFDRYNEDAKFREERAIYYHQNRNEVKDGNISEDEFAKLMEKYDGNAHPQNRTEHASELIDSDPMAAKNTTQSEDPGQTHVGEDDESDEDEENQDGGDAEVPQVEETKVGDGTDASAKVDNEHERGEGLQSNSRQARLNAHMKRIVFRRLQNHEITETQVMQFYGEYVTEDDLRIFKSQMSLLRGANGVESNEEVGAAESLIGLKHEGISVAGETTLTLPILQRPATSQRRMAKPKIPSCSLFKKIAVAQVNEKRTEVSDEARWTLEGAKTQWEIDHGIASFLTAAHVNGKDVASASSAEGISEDTVAGSMSTRDSQQSILDPALKEAIRQYANSLLSTGSLGDRQDFDSSSTIPSVNSHHADHWAGVQGDGSGSVSSSPSPQVNSSNASSSNGTQVNGQNSASSNGSRVNGHDTTVPSTGVSVNDNQINDTSSEFQAVLKQQFSAYIEDMMMEMNQDGFKAPEIFNEPPVAPAVDEGVNWSDSGDEISGEVLAHINYCVDNGWINHLEVLCECLRELHADIVDVIDDGPFKQDDFDYLDEMVPWLKHRRILESMLILGAGHAVLAARFCQKGREVIESFYRKTRGSKASEKEIVIQLAHFATEFIAAIHEIEAREAEESDDEDSATAADANGDESEDEESEEESESGATDTPPGSMLLSLGEIKIVDQVMAENVALKKVVEAQKKQIAFQKKRLAAPKHKGKAEDVVYTAAEHEAVKSLMVERAAMKAKLAAHGLD